MAKKDDKIHRTQLPGKFDNFIKLWPIDADTSRFIDPFDDIVLIKYYQEIAKWHGYIRFLGLPHLRDNPDLPIARLYVEPEISESHIDANLPPEQWSKCSPALDAIINSPRLVLLGDPGSGKSTLVSWLAWQLSQPGENAWTERLHRLIPIPMILREMKLGTGLTWYGLLDSFLAHPIAKPLRDHPEGRQRLLDALTRGQVLIMLDGLDEIGDVAVRKALKNAFFSGLSQYIQCRWILTSRIVGYDEVPFHFQRVSDFEREWFGKVAVEYPSSDVSYIAPFSDKQIKQFSGNWYTQHEKAEYDKRKKATDLVEAITSNEGTRRLARVPNLLTLIALIHRVRARLPHGRVLLYDRIAEAYLESIDEFRGLSGLDYSLAEKKRWLAHVGFKMQQQRSESSSGKHESERSEILVPREQLLDWIAEAMGDTVSNTRISAAKFVDYIARRSGLLLPRGEDQFAFTHLSFQGYFAACKCAEQVMAARWLDDRAKNPLFTPDDLRGFANDSVWRETLVLLFESLADRQGWPDALAECIYGENFADLKKDTKLEKMAAVSLLAEIATDTHAGLSPACRRLALIECWFWELSWQQTGVYYLKNSSVASSLLSGSPAERTDVWDAFENAVTNDKARVEVKQLKLRNQGITDDELRHLGSLTSLTQLSLGGNPIVGKGFKHLERFTRLEVLYLNDTKITDDGIRKLASITTLKSLNLSGTKITDDGIRKLARITTLKSLRLSYTEITDQGIKYLASFADLELLSLNGTNITGIGFGHLTCALTLEILLLARTRITDEELGILAGFTALRTLDLGNTGITDTTLKHVAALNTLKALILSDTKVTDAGLKHLAGLTTLEYVSLIETKVTDAGIKHLVGLISLRHLFLGGTAITDEGLRQLEHLNAKIYR